MNASVNRAAVWSQYWSHGAEHSCGGSYEGGYGDAITHYWRTCFETLPSQARMLDIGTGNGPLPRIFLNLDTRSDLHCDAVDLATVAPAWLNELSVEHRQRIKFHSNCQAELLPFECQTFDLIVSQWGLEYCDLEKALPEVLRVLKPGGIIQLLLHQKDALPVQLAGHELEHLDWLLRSSTYLATVERMLIPMVQARTTEGRQALKYDGTANRLRAEFNQLQDVIQARIDTGHCPDVLHEVRRATAKLYGIASQHGLVSAQEALQNLQQELLHSELRLQELCKYAMDENAVRALASQLSRGADFQLGQLLDQERAMGWTLNLRPQPALPNLDK